MTDYRPFERSFYEPSAKAVAPRLLGHWLLRRVGEVLCGGLIVETEAYLVGDPACHGAPGPTARNQALFGPAGHAYVYLIYGMHFCVNAVCRPPGVAEAVLIRALEPVAGLEMMRRSRKRTLAKDLTSGPAKLCQAMAIDLRLNRADLCDARSPLIIARNPSAESFLAKAGPMVTGRRIGITKAAHLPLRFHLRNSGFASHPNHA